jgi:uncharacterized protein
MIGGPSSSERIVRELYACVAANNFAGAAALLADDAEFIQAESLPFGGRYAGQDGFAAMASKIVAAWPGFAVTPVAFMSDGGERVVVQTELAGKGLQMPMLELWTVRNERIVRCQPFYFDTVVAAASASNSLATPRPP